MTPFRAAFCVLACAMAAQAPPAGQNPRNIWESQYRLRSPEEMAAQFESDRRPVFRHRERIVELLDLRPGLTVAEIGAGSGFLSRMVSPRVGPSGRVVATELDQRMVDYMRRRAGQEGLSNVDAVLGAPDSTGLPARSADVVLIVNTYSFFDRPAEMMRSVAETLRPGGLLVIVDFPASGGEGADPDDVTRTTVEAGFTPVDRRNDVPGHYVLRFRRAP